MNPTKQTGFINKGILPSDYRTGALMFKERLSSGDWRKYLPTKEKQFNMSFDTMSCTTFSALNTIEMQVNWMIQTGQIPEANLAGLKGLGFIDENGLFNCSDRFTAIMSNTTKFGNWFQAVWDSIRNDGILAEVHFPFGGNFWEEYHDKKLITEDMKAKARQAKQYLTFAYEFVTYDEDPAFSQDQQNACRLNLKQSPLHIAIPTPGTHAIVLDAMDDTNNYCFDTYAPFELSVPRDFPIHYALKGIVDVVSVVARTLKIGMVGEDVRQLQKDLKTLGYFGFGSITNYFGPVTQRAVMQFQKAYGLKSDGAFGPMSRSKMTEALKKKPEVIPSTTKLDRWAGAIQEFEGYYAGSRSHRNNNPGNIKTGSFATRNGATGSDGTFAIFPDYKTGFEALKSLLRLAGTGKSTYYNMNGDILAWANVYAPASDNNYPSRYAAYVATKIGVPISTPIKELV